MYKTVSLILCQKYKDISEIGANFMKYFINNYPQQISLNNLIIDQF